MKINTTSGYRSNPMWTTYTFLSFAETCWFHSPYKQTETTHHPRYVNLSGVIESSVRTIDGPGCRISSHPFEFPYSWEFFGFSLIHLSLPVPPTCCIKINEKGARSKQQKMGFLLKQWRNKCLGAWCARKKKLIGRFKAVRPYANHVKLLTFSLGI